MINQPMRLDGRDAAAALIALMLSFAFICSASAADHFVRPNGGAYGAKNGTNWNNAFDGFSGIAWASIAPGDTLWVAGGTYTQDLMPQKKGSSSARLNIRRARSDAAPAATAMGWSAGFDSTVHQINGAGITFNGDWDYITISGRTNSTGGSRGWWIDLRGRTAGTGIEFVNGAAADYNVLEYMDIQGPGYITYTGDGRGIDATPFSTAAGNTFSHINVWDWESAIYLGGMAETTFEYMEMYNVGAVNWSTFHPNGLYTVSADGLTIRYSRFHSGAGGLGIGEGIFAEQSGGCNHWRIYGNVFYDLSSKVIQITSNIPSAKVVNNTFFNTSFFPIQIRSDQGGACGPDSETTNNLFYGSAGYDICGTGSHNLTIASALNPFVDSANKNFHIIANVDGSYPRNAGINRPLLLTSDADGVAFGADGTWDVGAYEFAPQRFVRRKDFNADGKDDLLLRHPSSGSVSLWLMR